MTGDGLPLAELMAKTGDGGSCAPSSRACCTGSSCGRAWLARQPVPDDGRVAIERHARQLDRLGEDLAAFDKENGAMSLDDRSAARLITITGVTLTVAGLVAAIGDIGVSQVRKCW